MAHVEKCDIVVIGGGSAAFEAAVAAHEAGAKQVVMLEKAPEAEYGGNARYSGTGFRFVHAGAEEIREFVPDVDDALFATMAIPPYGADDFMADVFQSQNQEGLIVRLVVGDQNLCHAVFSLTYARTNISP